MKKKLGVTLFLLAALSLTATSAFATNEHRHCSGWTWPICKLV